MADAKLPRELPAEFTELADSQRAAMIAEVFDLITTNPKVKQRSDLSAIPRNFLWLCDIGCLEAIVDDLKSPPENIEGQQRVERILYVLDHPEALYKAIIKPWLGDSRKGKTSLSMPGESSQASSVVNSPSHQAQASSISPLLDRKRSAESAEPDSSAMPPPSQPIVPNQRDMVVSEEAYKRDQGCVVKGTPDLRSVLHVAHIFPFCMNKAAAAPRSKLWTYLSLFWPAEKVDSWKATLGTKARSEIIQNMMTVNIEVHYAWDACLFALKPESISADRKKMSLTFFWLKQGQGQNWRLMKHEYISKPDFPSNMPHGARGLNFFNNDGEVIKTGSLIELYTRDPIESPLPSFELLELQYHLSRLAAMIGGADRIENVLDDDSDDDFGVSVSSILYSNRTIKRDPYETPNQSQSVDDGDDLDGGKKFTGLVAEAMEEGEDIFI